MYGRPARPVYDDGGGDGHMGGCVGVFVFGGLVLLGLCVLGPLVVKLAKAAIGDA